ncbi:MAG: PilZ domain-containing protein [Myxococcales bacterium]
MVSAQRAPRIDKRSHQRAPIEIAVVCERQDGSSIGGTARDIGIGGMFIESNEQPDYAEPVVIVGRLPGARHDVRLPGVVRWSKANGFGVQFGSLGAQETHAILSLVK